METAEITLLEGQREETAEIAVLEGQREETAEIAVPEGQREETPETMVRVERRGRLLPREVLPAAGIPVAVRILLPTEPVSDRFGIIRKAT